MRAWYRVLSFLSLSLCAYGAAAQTGVAAFSPEGAVKGVRQVTARFSSQMVAFGDPRAADPFNADCAEKGTGRWIDGTTWSYDFERDVPGAVACTFTLRPDARDLAGQPLGGKRAFAFNTGGPSVVRALPHEGSQQVDEQQIFLLALDAPARTKDIEHHAWCRADGVNEKIGVRVLAGEERERVLAQRREFVDRHLTVYWRARGRTWQAALPLKNKLDDGFPLVALQCRRTLPADVDLALVWGKGIAAPNGVAVDADQTLAYRTRPDFNLSLRCERVNAKAGCVPFLPVSLDFSAPVAMAEARKIHLEGPDGKRFAAAIGDEGKGGFVSALTFPGPFPELATLQLRLPAGLRDDAGRPLTLRKAGALALRVDRQPPLVKFSAPFGIIEARGDRLLPVTVRNVEARLATSVRSSGASLRLTQEQDVMAWLGRLNSYGGTVSTPPEQSGAALQRQVLGPKAGGAIERFALPKPNGRRAFEVVGIPLRQPGFYVVELASPQLGRAINDKGRTAYVHTTALVTNLAAHFKHGAESSLVWVTSLDKGRPVARAQVGVRNCAGKLLWSGATDANGVARIAQPLARSECHNEGGYFVSARSGDDFTFTLSEWQRGIEPWRFNLNTESLDKDSRLVATVFDRTLLRAGETVHMKHFLRRRVGAGLALVNARDPAPRNVPSMLDEDAAADKAPRPSKGVLVHQGSGDKVTFDLTWDAAGQAHGEWTIPAESKLGQYDVVIGGQVAGSFRVEQFRVPTMKAVLKGPAEPAVAPRSIVLDAQVNYLAGGPAGGAPVKLRTVSEPAALRFDDYEGFAFAGGDVKEGVEQEGTQDDEGFDEEGAQDDAQDASVEAARTQSLTLDRAGGARMIVPDLPQMDQPRTLLAELTYQDANGETLTASTRVPLWPSRLALGIKQGSWLSGDTMKFQVAVLDVKGKPAAGTQVEVDVFQRVTYSHRRRLVGGFYAYENSSEIKRIGAACAGTSDARGLLLCELKAPAEGNLILRARAVDAAGRPSLARSDVWVAGRDAQWFEASDNDRIDLLPVKPRFEPGERASFQLRMPFRAATVLVTVEREGILDTYLRRISAQDPTITLPIKASYAPNVFVSALVVRGRVAGVQPTALVDLGKPAYKLGIAPVRVGWAAHELQVEVASDKPVYKVRERAAVRIKVTRADGKPLPAGAEIALAAVDVGLLELKPNDSWKLLDTMMGERGLQVETSTAQMQVVGKRHFGRKAVAHGGGGGQGASRELFDTLLLWQGKVKLDAKGEAQVTVPLNDSLTGFRIVAVASAGVGLFGTGSVDVRSTQDLMLMSGLPQLVRAGDRLRAGFTVRNASERAQQVQLAARLTADAGAPRSLAAQTVTLDAGASRELFWDLTVPQAQALRWQVDAKSGAASDSIRIVQKVGAAVPVRTLQATLLQIDGPKSMQVERPLDALPGYGGVRTTLSARLGGSLAGVRDYMAAYPYSCFEQRTSRAVALRDEKAWTQVAATLPVHLDGDGLVKYFASMLEGSDSLTAYILSVTAEAGFEIAQDARERMQAGLIAFVEGKIVRGSGLRTGELAVRKLAALAALSRIEPVRQEWLQSFTVEPTLWPTSAVIDWYLVLQRSPALERRDNLLAQAQQILRARLNLQGTTMGFSTERSDDWWWLMASPDVNANRLLLAMLDNPAWQGDMGRLARGTLGRQQKGHWGTTLANAWGTLALEKFSAKFEAQPVTGQSSAVLAGAGKPASWTGTVPNSVLQAWPEGRAQLTLRHEGGGKPWATVQSLAAVPLKAPLSSGYRIARSVTPVEQAKAGSWARGDVYRVKLDLEAQADMSWVVVDDPIPASASILGTGLGRDAQIATRAEARRGWVQPDFEERSSGAFRAYYSWVPKGKWSIEYTVRLNNEGNFNLPPTRVEAMYSPEMFGEAPNAAVVVGH